MIKETTERPIDARDRGHITQEFYIKLMATGHPPSDKIRVKYEVES